MNRDMRFFLYMLFFAGVCAILGKFVGNAVGEWIGKTILLNVFCILGGGLLGAFGYVVISVILYSWDLELYEDEVRKSRQKEGEKVE